MDEVFVRIGGKQYYFYSGVDQDVEIVDVFLQKRHSGLAVKRFVSDY
ncbi:MAG: transposase-like protein [Arenicella sp.]